MILHVIGESGQIIGACEMPDGTKWTLRGNEFVNDNSFTVEVAAVGAPRRIECYSDGALVSRGPCAIQVDSVYPLWKIQFSPGNLFIGLEKMGYAG